MHGIKPKTIYSIVHVAIAIEGDNEADVADGLNEMLRPCVHEDFIADYELRSSHKAPIIVRTVMSGEEPEEGDLFAADPADNGDTAPDSRAAFVAKVRASLDGASGDQEHDWLLEALDHLEAVGG